MPEAFTYHDMSRRIVAAFPDRQTFSLRIIESSSRYRGINEEVAQLRRKEKLKARQDDPSDFGNDVAATFPGLDQLPEEIRNGSIRLSGTDIKSRGKAIGIPLDNDWWINIHLRMHGHIVVISAGELAEIDPSVTMQLALVNQDHSKPSIIVVDRIRLATLTFVHAPTAVWWSKKQGPCPITDPGTFAVNYDRFALPNRSEDSIFQILTRRQDFFNGIGTSHANEILHLALEHPAQKANDILQNSTRRAALKDAIARFFDFAHSERYKRSIPAGRSGGSAFFEPHYLTRNIISMQQRVYGHTRSPTKISKAEYTQLFDRGLLDPKYQALGIAKRGRALRDGLYDAKWVEVYAIRFLIQSKKTNQVRDGQYAYTVICKTPPGCVAVRYETREKAERQALGSRSAEIGIASFMDNVKMRQFEKNAFKRRFPVKNGKPGRPRKSKDAKRQARFGTDRSSSHREINKLTGRPPNKDLVVASAVSAGTAQDVAVSDDDGISASDGCEEPGESGENGPDGEDAVLALETAIAIDEASSESDDDEEVNAE